METEITHRGPGRPPNRKEEDRPEMRADDPRELARIREQEILGNLGNLDEHQDELWYDPDIIPAGWSWEWKRYSVLNEIQHSHINALKRTGWEFVSAKKYPSLVPAGATEEIIVRRGNALMERPETITKMMAARDQRMAVAQMETKAAQMEGKIGKDFGQTNKGEPIRAHGVAGVKKSYSPMTVPE